MKPALSIVVFTVLSGAGLGLACWSAVLQEHLQRNVFFISVAAAVLLVAAGLMSSVAHLATPKNAWRSFMRVRTSWLSREAVLAALFFPLTVLWFFCRWNETENNLNFFVLIISMLTIKCTAMIYQSLKPIGEWNHPLTSINYFLFAMMSGALLLFCVVAVVGDGDIVVGVFSLSGVVVLLSTAAAAAKLLHYRRIGKAKDINIGRATGFSAAKARLLEAGHTGDTFLTREFIYQKPASTLSKLRYLSFSLFALSPILAAATERFFMSPFFVIVLTVATFVGLLIERWLFFAEARHIVRLYHGVGKP